MRRPLPTALIALMGAFAVAQESRTAEGGPAATRPYEPRLIEVRVVDENGAPIPDAKLTLMPRTAPESRRTDAVPRADVARRPEVSEGRTRSDGTKFVRGTGVRSIVAEALGRAGAVGTLDFDAATPGAVVRLVLDREATLRWTPSRPPTEFENYDVRFERSDAPTLTGGSVAPAFELVRDTAMQRGVLDASRRSAWTGAALGVPYRAVLYDLLGEVPGCAVDVAPLSGGEERRVVVPLPDGLGVVRLRVTTADGRPAAGAQLRYRPAPTDGSAPVFEDGSFAPSFFVGEDGDAILRDVRVAPLTVWIVDGEKGWGTLRTTAGPIVDASADELRLRPARRLVYRFRTRFGDLGGVCVRAVDADGSPVPVATSDDDPQRLRWAGGALLCPADGLKLVWRVGGRNLSVDLPDCEPFARDEREAPLPGIGELVIKTAGERPSPAIAVEPLRVPGLDGWASEDGARALAAAGGGFRRRPRFERRLALWPGVWLVRTDKGESKEVEVKADESATVVLP